MNGLGESEVRQASPFFWHPVDKHAFGPLQQEVIAYHRRSPEITEHYSSSAPRGPRPVRKAAQKVEKALHEMKRGKLRSGGSGRKVRSREQAIAIGLSQARRAGGKVPANPNEP